MNAFWVYGNATPVHMHVCVHSPGAILEHGLRVGAFSPTSNFDIFFGRSNHFMLTYSPEATVRCILFKA